MLILTRRVGEKVFIGDDIEVVVVDIQGGQVVIGFTAPKAIPIQREEIHNKIKTEEVQ